MTYHFGLPILENKLTSDQLSKLRSNIKDLTENNLGINRPWNSNTKTTHGLFNLLENEEFNWLIDVIKQNFNNYVELCKFNINQNMNFKIQAWINFADKGEYQEIHDHLDNMGSPILSGNILLPLISS